MVAALTCALIFAKSVKEKAGELGQNPEALYEELDTFTTQGNLLSLQAMQQARQLVEAGEYNKANDKLRFLINFYSEASFADEARGILGALNLDQLMSPSSSKYKTSYKVKSGDSLSRIAKKHDSTVENIMEINGFLYPDRIHPDQEMQVMALNFRTVIDVGDKTIALYDGQTFVKDYPLLEVTYGGKNKMITTKIEQTMAYDGGSMISRISSKYRSNKKLIILKDGRLLIRPVRHPDEADPGSGFFLSETDMEEYNLLVRPGGEVEIRL